MTYSVFENTLAKLLTDEKYLAEFQKDPQSALTGLNLTQDEKIALIDSDASQLSVAAQSFRKKRTQHRFHGNVIKLFFRNLLRRQL